MSAAAGFIWAEPASGPDRPAATGTAAAESMNRRRRQPVRTAIVQALLSAGPEGLTVEQIAERTALKESTVNGRCSGRSPELADVVKRTARTRRNRTGAMAAVFVHAKYSESCAPWRSPRLPTPADLSPADREAFEERAAIMEVEGGLARPRAEAEALAAVLGRSHR